MGDEIDANAVPEYAEADAPVIAAEPKKARAKRRTPAELAAAAAAKSKRSNSRKNATLTDESKQITAAATDEFTDLLQLEQENKGLRKSLAEKLRAENADLRKRLGQA